MQNLSNLLAGLFSAALLLPAASDYKDGFTSNRRMDAATGKAIPPARGDCFDPATDRFMNRAVFPAQSVAFGNVTRHNPKQRNFPILNEGISRAKKFSFNERFSADFRWEAFNLLNRTRFSTGSQNLDSSSFGLVTSQLNEPRRMQLGLKLYW